MTPSVDIVSSGSLFWNPGAISYLAQGLLALVLATLLLVRCWAEWRRGRLQAPTVMLAVLMLALSGAYLASMMRLLAAGGWLSYVMPWSQLESWTSLIMPWSRPFGAIASAALLLLAYLFPQPLSGARRELRLVALLLLVLILVEGWIAVRADLAIVSREIWWRPQWIVGWMSVAMVWAALVFWRQFLLACSQAGETPAPWKLARLWRSAPNRQARVARAFLLLTLLPILHTAALVLPDEAQSTWRAFDIFICWSALVQLVGLTLVLFGYLPERSSLLFKLTVIGLAVLLAMVNGAAWMVAPAYEAQFQAHAPIQARGPFQGQGLPQSGESLRFEPIGGVLGYAVAPTVFVPERARGRVVGDAGAAIDLPFALRFYGRTYRKVHVSRLGSIGLGHAPRPSNAAFEDGVLPTIYPLLVDVPPSGTQLTAFADAQRLIVTRRDRCTPRTAQQCYQVQTIIHADGRIDMHYLDMPGAPRYVLFDPLHAPWLMGITPGVSTRAGAAVLNDFYHAFLVHLDRLYAPLVLYTLLTFVVAAICLPLLFRRLLIEPLDRLIGGIRQYREGDLDTQVAVGINDEIGYLIETFNTMAQAQTALTRGLEDRVADRVAEIADLTVRSARLEERARLSADLHDAVAQSLASATLHANALSAQIRHSDTVRVEAAEQVARLNRHALDEMRQLLGELRRDVDAESGDDRMTRLIDGFVRLHGLDIQYVASDTALLPPEIFAIFYRVAQECLNNVVKHSGVARVEMIFEALGDRAMLMVRDDGRGFDQAEVDRRERLGLAIMRERARQIGASLELETAPGQGCRVTMIWVR